MPRKMQPSSLKNLRPRKKGEPPSPLSGRPKGSRDRLTIVEELLACELTPEAIEKVAKGNPLAMSIRGKTLRDVMWLRLGQKALNGDMAALDRLEDVMRPLKRHLVVGEDPENPLPPSALTPEDMARIFAEAAAELKLATGGGAPSAATSKPRTAAAPKK